jgi:SAM-dependent methyltransferase
VNAEHVSLLRCPSCRGGLELREIQPESGHVVETGTLVCARCAQAYPVLRSIPRFVPSENYASNFGLEWSRHARTQYDGESGVALSEQRFFEQTGWPRDMRGQTLLEAGSGSGRFTEHAARTGATVVSFDLSDAVEANHATNGAGENVLIVQADVFRAPFPPASFDKVFCFGVLQHTPDPRGAFMALARFLAPGGELAIDVYRKTFTRYALQTKYWVRPVTRNLDPANLYRWVRRYVDAMWPLASAIRRIPRIGVPLNWRLLIADYSNRGVPDEKLKEWAVLDTFDMLSPRHDHPQTLNAVREWFAAAGLVRVEVEYGCNGIHGRGARPREASADPPSPASRRA